MIERQVDILSFSVLDDADAVCFTSNGVVKNDGTLTMGKGVAKQFADRFIGLSRAAGIAVDKHGNVCQIVALRSGVYIVTFPTKHDWRENSDLNLIVKSAKELMKLIEDRNWNKVYMSFPGCGCGKLNKEDVRAAIKDILDDRVIVCCR